MTLKKTHYRLVMTALISANTKGLSPQLRNDHQVQKVITQKPRKNPIELKTANLVQSEKSIPPFSTVPTQIHEIHEQINYEKCACCNRNTNTCYHIINEFSGLCDCKGIALGTCGATGCYVAAMLCQICLNALR